MHWVGVLEENHEPEHDATLARQPHCWRQSMYELALHGCHSISFLMEQAGAEIQRDKEQEEYLLRVFRVC